MGRLRDHKPRDNTMCPDPDACTRLYHPRLEYGDVCECCGRDTAKEVEARERQERIERTIGPLLPRFYGHTDGA